MDVVAQTKGSYSQDNFSSDSGLPAVFTDWNTPIVLLVFLKTEVKGAIFESCSTLFMHYSEISSSLQSLMNSHRPSYSEPWEISLLFCFLKTFSLFLVNLDSYLGCLYWNHRKRLMYRVNTRTQFSLQSGFCSCNSLDFSAFISVWLSVVTRLMLSCALVWNCVLPFGSALLNDSLTWASFLFRFKVILSCMLFRFCFWCLEFSPAVTSSSSCFLRYWNVLPPVNFFPPF